MTTYTGYNERGYAKHVHTVLAPLPKLTPDSENTSVNFKLICEIYEHVEGQKWDIDFGTDGAPTKERLAQWLRAAADRIDKLKETHTLPILR